MLKLTLISPSGYSDDSHRIRPRALRGHPPPGHSHSRRPRALASCLADNPRAEAED